MKKLFLLSGFTLCISLYYISYAAIISYATLFLQMKGFNNTEIGVFYSISSLLCIVGQIYAGAFLDRHSTLSTKIIIISNTLVALMACSILYFATNRYIMFISYVLINMIMLLNSSLFNAFGMEYINAGRSLNYSLSRGFGSLFYAISAFFTGQFISRFSISVMFFIFFTVQSALLLSICLLPSAKKESFVTQNRESSDTDTTKNNFFTLFKENPKLIYLFVSILLIYMSYSSVNNFHINIISSVGGGSKELGISASLAALLELPVMVIFIPVSRKVSYKTLLKASCLCFFLKVTAFSMVHSVFQVYLVQLLQLCSYGLFTPASAYYINSILADKNKAKGQTALGIFTFGLSGVIASMTSGILLDYISVHHMLIIQSLIAFIGVIGVFRVLKVTD